MKRYRKKPVVIEAVQITVDNLYEVEKWCGGQVKGTALPWSLRCIDIQTSEGEMRADMGDWVIKGVEGEFYPCKPSIFSKCYDLADEFPELEITGVATDEFIATANHVPAGYEGPLYAVYVDGKLLSSSRPSVLAHELILFGKNPNGSLFEQRIFPTPIDRNQSISLQQRARSFFTTL